MKLSQAINFSNLENKASPEFAGANVGEILSVLLTYIFPFAGLLMLVYLLYGGYKYMLSQGDPKALQGAKGTITTALIGFVIVFVSYWLVQIVGIALGLNVVSFIFK